ncbi:hypothetical protein AVEN_198023-1 [Araneus ventricosus]|uniref:Uncharacterized protein n=1 Tax=Araneus ventricosus TaxID=182803 RepID=A0A4Y2KN13_ARAVE|nr:hypothetical protein AVEN_198023-1 [Araneus ventricosus]
MKRSAKVMAPTSHQRQWAPQTLVFSKMRSLLIHSSTDRRFYCRAKQKCFRMHSSVRAVRYGIPLLMTAKVPLLTRRHHLILLLSACGHCNWISKHWKLLCVHIASFRITMKAAPVNVVRYWIADCRGSIVDLMSPSFSLVVGIWSLQLDP